LKGNRALEQINEQYWVASFLIWGEAWANFRRSGYPHLSPINYPGADPSVKSNLLCRNYDDFGFRIVDFGLFCLML